MFYFCYSFRLGIYKSLRLLLSWWWSTLYIHGYIEARLSSLLNPLSLHQSFRININNINWAGLPYTSRIKSVLMMQLVFSTKMWELPWLYYDFHLILLLLLLLCVDVSLSRLYLNCSVQDLSSREWENRIGHGETRPSQCSIIPFSCPYIFYVIYLSLFLLFPFLFFFFSRCWEIGKDRQIISY
jgi:hypothetical protein